MFSDRSGSFVHSPGRDRCSVVPVCGAWYATAHPLDNGPKFVAKTVLRWLQRADLGTLLIAKGSPWENGYVKSEGGKLRDKLLNQELFLSLAEVRWVIDRWRLDYNHHRIHSALNYQTPAAYAAGCVLPASVTPQPPEQSRVT